MSQAGIVIVACVSCYLCGIAIGAWLRREDRANQVRALASRNADLALALKAANEELAWAFDELFTRDERLRKYETVRGELKSKAEAMLVYCDELDAERERQ